MLSGSCVDQCKSKRNDNLFTLKLGNKRSPSLQNLFVRYYEMPKHTSNIEFCALEFSDRNKFSGLPYLRWNWLT